MARIHGFNQIGSFAMVALRTIELPEIMRGSAISVCFRFQKIHDCGILGKFPWRKYMVSIKLGVSQWWR